MMRFTCIIYSLLLLHTASCGDSAPDCFQSAGRPVEVEELLPDFDKIEVWPGVQLFLSQGDEQRVVLETGENLLSDTNLRVEDGRLIAEDKNDCNLFRDYGLTRVYVTAPDIAEIWNNSQYAVESRGLLRFPSLRLISENNSGDHYAVGDFRLEVETGYLEIYSNNKSNFFLKGMAEVAYFASYSGDSRIEAQKLEVENLHIFHRGSNRMFVNPRAVITGSIRSVGDVIAVNRPPVVEVETYYTGQLIFTDIAH